MSLNSGVNKTLNYVTVHAVATADHQIAYCDITCWYDAIMLSQLILMCRESAYTCNTTLKINAAYLELRGPEVA